MVAYPSRYPGYVRKPHWFPMWLPGIFRLTLQVSGGRSNIKMPSYQYRKSHRGDKTILRPSYLHNRISYTGKLASLYWIRALVAMLSRHPAKFQRCTRWPLSLHFTGNESDILNTVTKLFIHCRSEFIWGNKTFEFLSFPKLLPGRPAINTVVADALVTKGTAVCISSLFASHDAWTKWLPYLVATF